MPGTSLITAIGAPPLGSGSSDVDLLRWCDQAVAYRKAEVSIVRSLTYFYSNSAGNNGNDGRDGLGLNLTGATYTASTRTLTKVGGFTSYTHYPKALIYLSAGVSAGLYMIESKTSADAVVLSAVVDAYEGNLAAPGADATGVSSSNGPRKTVANAYTTLTASTGVRNMRIRLRRGDEWNETAAFTNISNCHNWTLDAYGPGAEPLISFFSSWFPASPWVQYSSSTVWYCTLPSTYTSTNTAWIREIKNRLKPYIRIDQQGSTVTFTGTVTGGTFTLTVGGNTTTAIAYNASNATVQSAVGALASVGGSSNVTVTGTAGAWTIVLKYNAQNYPITATSSLTGSTPGITVDNDTLNLAKVQTVPWSFCMSSANVLYVNFGGWPPNTADGGGRVVLEATKISSSTPGITVNTCDDVYIRGLRFDGWNQNFQAPCYGVQLYSTNYDRVVAVGLRCYYTGYHAFGTSTYGGQNNESVTMIDCAGGWTTPWTGETCFVAFSGGSAAEMIFVNCHAQFGSLPSDTWVNFTDYRYTYFGRGQGFYSHTVGGVHALLLLWNCKSGMGNSVQYAPDMPFDATNLPPATTMDQARGLVIGFKVLGYPLNLGIALTFTNAVVYGLDAELKTKFNNAYHIGGGNGWGINNRVLVDCQLMTQSAAQTYLYPWPVGIGASGSTGTLAFSEVRFFNIVNQVSIGPYSGTAAMVVTNSIISTTGTTAAKSLNTNDATHLIGNAYGGYWDTTTISGDATRIYIPSVVGNGPTRGWEGEGTCSRVLPNGFIVKLDLNGTLRQAATCPGAIETNPTTEQASYTGRPMVVTL